MEKIKTILDRKPLSSEYISSKQDFGKVLKGVKHLKPPVWKSAWFYGAVGMAAIATVVTVIALSSDPVLEQNQTTTAQESPIITSPDRVEPKVASHLIAQNDQPVEIQQVVEITPVQEEPEPQEVQREIPESVPVVTADEKEEEEATPPAKNTMPHIAGFFTGRIPFEDFCDPDGIQVNEDIEITSYTIQYYSCSRDVTANIKGSKIPETVCREIGDCGKDIMVFLTNIRGRDVNTGKIHSFDSLNLIPSK